MMTVRLIAHTPEPEKVVAAAAKLCYSDSHIADLLDGLDDREKWLLYLRYVSGYTYVEIARMLALPYEQVKKQGYRAYLKLKRAWEG